jgi:toxin-antitoxin system PIN domain toxin
VSRSLLDVNVLLALLDSDHVDHSTARDWLAGEIADGWASCAITESGFVRILSHPRYPNAVSVAEAMERLANATESEHHELWPCDRALVDRRLFDPTRLHGPRQVTDAYLLALAVARDGRFVTFDHTVPLQAVAGAKPRHLVVL